MTSKRFLPHLKASAYLVYGKICDRCDYNEFTKVSKEVNKKMFWKQTLICVESHAFVIGSEVSLGSYSRIVAIISGFILFAIWKKKIMNFKNWKKPKVFELYFQNILWYLPVVWIHKQILLQVTGRQTLKAQRWNRPVTEVSSPEKKIIEKVKDILGFRLSIFFWPKALYLIAGFLITFWHNVFNPFSKDNF